jgi:hypothetical protein
MMRKQDNCLPVLAANQDPDEEETRYRRPNPTTPVQKDVDSQFLLAEVWELILSLLEMQEIKALRLCSGT